MLLFDSSRKSLRRGLSFSVLTERNRERIVNASMGKTRSIRILFVCTGNICRSPMAQALLTARMPRSWRGRVAVSSAGTAAPEGVPASSNAVKALAEIGPAPFAHAARLLTAKMIDDSDLVVAMKRAHRDVILTMAPGAGDKVIVMGEVERGRDDPDVADPIGGDEEVYRRTRDEIDRLVGLLIDYLARRFELNK
jgi:protein-tyrosine-phosphatase